MKTPGLSITNHAMRQYATRFEPDMKRDVDLMISNNDHCLKNKYRKKLRHEIKQGTIDKSYINDTERMMYLYDHYGYDTKFVIFKSNNKTFVGVQKSEDEIVIVTCYKVKQSERNARSRFTSSKK